VSETTIGTQSHDPNLYRAPMTAETRALTVMIPAPTITGFCSEACPLSGKCKLAIWNRETMLPEPGPGCPWYEPADGKEKSDE